MITLVDFSRPEGVADWRPVNDVVMGGVSSGRIDRAEDSAVFSGVLSLDRGGGFASVRGPVRTADLSACTGVAVRVRGDGKTYRLRLYDSGRFDGVAWQARFEAPVSGWATRVLPFHLFEASFRGRVLRDVPPLRTDRLRQAGLMIAERQAGPFRLQVRWVRGHDCEAPGTAG
ncbi:MAG: CIA30 family protein [Gammaproteobacteria bacterium]